MTVEELEDKVQKIQDYLEKECDVYFPKIQERLSNLSTFLALSGRYLAEAKYLQDTSVIEEANKLIDEIK